MISEKIRFELFLGKDQLVDLQVQALLIFGKLLNVDPSRKIVSYEESDQKKFPLWRNPIIFLKRQKWWQNTWQLQSTINSLEKSRFTFNFSLYVFFMKWKEILFHYVFTSIMTLATTDNVHAGSSWEKWRIYQTLLLLKMDKNSSTLPAANMHAQHSKSTLKG